jgi:glucose/arabinose dehydrogenase
MGPRGGDEFNLLKPSENYGWPLVSNGENYDDSAIPLHSTRPDLAAPLLYWSPVIAPAGMALYEGSVFPNWRGSILITALRGQGLVRVTVSADGQVRQINRWDLGARIRDIAVATDGTVWLIEDGAAGRLLRLAPKQGSNQSSRQD